MDNDRIKVTVENKKRFYRKPVGSKRSKSPTHKRDRDLNGNQRFVPKSTKNSDPGWPKYDKFIPSQNPNRIFKNRDEGNSRFNEDRRPPIKFGIQPKCEPPRLPDPDTSYFRRSRSPPRFVPIDQEPQHLDQAYNDHHLRLGSPSRDLLEFERRRAIDDIEGIDGKPLSPMVSRWDNKEAVRPYELERYGSPARNWNGSPDRDHIMQATYEDRASIYKEADERYLQSLNREKQEQQQQNMMRSNSLSLDHIAPDLKKFVGSDSVFSMDRSDNLFPKSSTTPRLSSSGAPRDFNMSDVSNILKMVGMEDSESAQNYLDKVEVKKSTGDFNMVQKAKGSLSKIEKVTVDTSRSIAGGVLSVLEDELDQEKQKCIKFISEGTLDGKLERLTMLQDLFKKCTDAAGGKHVIPKRDKLLINDEHPDVEDTSYENLPSNYGDGGHHMCGICKRDFDRLPKFLVHLHTKSHKQMMDQKERPWAKNSKLGPNDSALPLAWSQNIKGADCLVPIEGFFCTVCERFCGDQVQAEIHLLSNTHNERYLTSFKDSVLNDKPTPSTPNWFISTGIISGVNNNQQQTMQQKSSIEMKQETFLANLMRKSDTKVYKHYRKDEDKPKSISSRRSTSPGSRRRSRTSQSPSRRRRHSPSRRRSPARRSRSPARRSRSPARRSRSPARRSRSPPYVSTVTSARPARRSPSPRRRFASPPRKRSRSPVARRNVRSPKRRSSKSPARRTSKSPARRSSKPPRKSSKSPARKSSTARRRSKSPARRGSKAPASRSSKSPVSKRSSPEVKRKRVSPPKPLEVKKSPVRSSTSSRNVSNNKKTTNNKNNSNKSERKVTSSSIQKSQRARLNSRGRRNASRRNPRKTSQYSKSNLIDLSANDDSNEKSSEKKEQGSKEEEEEAEPLPPGTETD